MKEKIILAISFIVLNGLNVWSQDTISLEKCRQSAVSNFPLSKSIDFYNQSGNYIMKKTSAAYLPKLNLNTQATWQSEVTSIDLSGLPFPVNISPPPNDQYKAVVEINQVIYDAGITKKLLALQQLETDLNIAGVKVEQFKIEDQVNQLYINILLAKKQIELISLTKSLIEEKLKKAEAGVRNGVLLQSQADVLKAEKLKIEQQLDGLFYKKKSLTEALSVLTGLTIAEHTVFSEVSETEISCKTGRPEYLLFDFQKKLIDKKIELLSSNRLPKVYSFGQVGYGRPGLNFLSSDFKPYAIAGASLNWNIWDWKQVKNEKSSLEILKEIVDTKKETFSQSLELLRISEINNINKYEEAIRKDMQIISLRENITNTASIQLDNGTITPTEFLTELNAEMQARLNLELNKLLLTQSKLNLEFLKGN